MFGANRDMLAAHSICYPDYRNPEHRVFGPQHSIVALDYDVGRSFESNFSRVFDINSDCDTLLISGEEFSRANTQPAFFAGLRSLAEEVTAVFYFRRFDHLLERVYSESVKEYLAGPIENAQYQLEFYEILRPFVEHLGPESIVVRPYNQALWTDGSLGQDFCTAVGFPHLWPTFSKTQDRINESLSRPETYMLSTLKGRDEKQRLLACLKTVPFEHYDTAKFFRSPEFRLEFNIDHARVNTGLSTLIGGMGVDEFLDLSNCGDDSDWSPFDSSDQRIVAYLENFRRSPFMHETLDSIGQRYGTDKSSAQNNFLNFYDRFLAPLRNKPVKLLEIGVLNGGSVRTWQEYFHNGKIVGVDINPEVKKFATGRVQIEVADQSKTQDLDALAEKGPFDIVVDDGSHVWPHQILTFRKLINVVKPGGFYIIEDLDTSYGKYVPHYHGGATESAAAYIQRLARLVVGQRVLNLEEEPDPFQKSLFSRIDFITFYRGAALIKIKDQA